MDRTPRAHPRWLRQLPNALSLARIVAAPVLVALAIAGREHVFTWVLVPALFSDIADGLIARAFRLQSKVGALLDSVADVLLLCASICGIAFFHADVLLQYSIECALLVTAWGVEMLAAFARYGRLSSFHTYLSKAAGYLLGIFIGVLFVSGFQPWLMHLAVAVSVLGNVEELALLALLPEWRPDVRGLAWVLRERRRETA